VVPVLALGLERAIALAEAMAARGFGVPQTDGVRIRRTAYRAHPWRMLDSVVTAGAVGTAIIVITAALHGSALIYYPYPFLLWPPFTPFVGLALLPLLLPALTLPYAGTKPPPALPPEDSGTDSFGKSRNQSLSRLHLATPRGRFEHRPYASVTAGERRALEELSASEPSDGRDRNESEVRSPSLGKRGSGGGNPLAHLAHVTYAYPRTTVPTLDSVSWDMCDSETTLLLGPSGAGKSTLLRLFNGLVPHFTGGRFGGAVIVAGHAAHREGPRGMSAVVGMLFQDPEAASVAPRVADDIAFALEQHGIPRAEMRRRVREALDAVGMAHLAEREIATLSGGERQRVALAAAIVRAPRLLVLDEPTSQLDPDGARAVLDAVAAVQTASGMAVILAEHRLERVIARATSGLFLPGDGSLANGVLRDILARAGSQSVAWAPPVVALGQALGWHPLPLSVADAAPFAIRDGLTALGSPPVTTAHPAGAPCVAASGLSVTLGGQPILNAIDLTLYAGEVIGVVGVNGAGKTTLLRALLGLRMPDAGQISVMGRTVTASGVAARTGQIGYVPQQPGALLFAETVADELAFTLRAQGRQAFPARYGDAEGLLTALRLDGMAHRYPRDLSIGERARVAIAATLAADPPILFLDEPTRGLDPDAKESLIAILRQLRDEGHAVLLVTHDAELVARAADRVILLDRGRIVADSHPRVVLPGSPFAPQINQLLGGVFLTVADVLAARAAHERAAVEA
ncbi:MAG: ATP-binding cassette domain-containing protein, partial [Chloroflexota bacterium]|nr:ATP-binding cassette domain-containing protein [Chloroflexota bacterium]